MSSSNQSSKFFYDVLIKILLASRISSRCRNWERLIKAVTLLDLEISISCSTTKLAVIKITKAIKAVDIPLIILQSIFFNSSSA